MKEFIEKLIARLEETVEFDKMTKMERRVGTKQTQGFVLGVRSSVGIVNQLEEECKNRIFYPPCEIGDTIWDNDYGYPCSYTVTGFDIGVTQDADEKHEEWYVYYQNWNGSISGYCPVSIIGKEVFLSREEAEEALVKRKK